MLNRVRAECGLSNEDFMHYLSDPRLVLNGSLYSHTEQVERPMPPARGAPRAGTPMQQFAVEIPHGAGAVLVDVKATNSDQAKAGAYRIFCEMTPDERSTLAASPSARRKLSRERGDAMRRAAMSQVGKKAISGTHDFVAAREE